MLTREERSRTLGQILVRRTDHPFGVELAAYDLPEHPCLAMASTPRAVADAALECLRAGDVLDEVGAGARSVVEAHSLAVCADPGAGDSSSTFRLSTDTDASCSSSTCCGGRCVHFPPSAVRAPGCGDDVRRWLAGRAAELGVPYTGAGTWSGSIGRPAPLVLPGLASPR